jgi:hypothetical protein
MRMRALNRARKRENAVERPLSGMGHFRFGSVFAPWPEVAIRPILLKNSVQPLRVDSI